jgi:hypothetical protein
MMLRSLGIFLALSAYASEPAIILGVLEDVPGQSVGKSPSRGVRVVFQKNGREWKPFPDSCPDEACLKTIPSKYPGAVDWTIAFSARSLGQVTAATPKEFELYSEMGLQKITSNNPIPTIGKRSAEFAGFLGSPVLRPLIANSQPYVKDPDAWKPSHPSPRQEASLRLAFRKKFPNVSNCSSQDHENAKPWQYRDTDIKIQKAYSSNKGWSAVEVQLTEYRCDGPEDDPFYEQWFAITPRGETMFLGAGMWLVDAGDYDNDGKSEIVFAINRYNSGGYEIFYDDFEGHAVFEFTYH